MDAKTAALFKKLAAETKAGEKAGMTAQASLAKAVKADEALESESEE